MILSFKTEINGKPTNFVEKILACYIEDVRKHVTPKMHTKLPKNAIQNGIAFFSF